MSSSISCRRFKTSDCRTCRVMPVSYVPQNFEIGMQVKVDSPTYDPTQVIAQVWQNLSAAFAFGQLAPGQSVAASQAIEIAQNVPGVIAVAVTAFSLSGAASGVANILCPAGPIPPDISGSNPPSERRSFCSIQRRKATWWFGHEDLPMSAAQSPIYSLLPAVFRTRDAAVGGPLQALFQVLEAQYALVHANVWQLYDDQFIETCAPWVIPYIGQLIGFSTLYTAALTSPG